MVCQRLPAAAIATVAMTCPFTSREKDRLANSPRPPTRAQGDSSFAILTKLAMAVAVRAPV